MSALVTGPWIALTLCMFWCALLAPEEAVHVKNIECMRTHQCIRQKTARNTQDALEQRHINARYICFVSLGGPLRHRIVDGNTPPLRCMSAWSRRWAHAGCSPSARTTGCDCVISAAVHSALLFPFPHYDVKFAHNIHRIVKSHNILYTSHLKKNNSNDYFII